MGADSFNQSLARVLAYLRNIEVALILIGVSDDTELRTLFLDRLREQLDGEIDLREFRYRAQHLSLLEGATDAAAAPNGGARHVEPIKYREPIPMPDYEPIANWIREHRQEYGGQWVALDGDRLIAQGLVSDDVFRAAEADGVRLPFVTYIEPADAPPFMGL
jgi:hypothetical protein